MSDVRSHACVSGKEIGEGDGGVSLSLSFFHFFFHFSFDDASDG